jgi:hypothetical protein
MAHSTLMAAGLTLLVFIGGAVGQETQPSDAVDLAPGFKMRSSGGIDIGSLYAEVVQFGTDWKETEEHDVFKPDISAPDANSHVATGDFATPSGTFNLTEHVATIDGGISFSAEMKSDKEVQTNELSFGFQLPVASVGGKQIVIDGQPLTMPMEAAKKGEAHLFGSIKDRVQEIDIPTPTGTLTLTGNFTILVQDDREWGDARYALRLQFMPGSGAVTESKIDLQMKWAPAGAGH